MDGITKIIINKNRGWRGLAELVCKNDSGDTIHTMIFSFSDQVWRDLMAGAIVTQDSDSYYVIKFANVTELPHGHQRSVLLKNFIAPVVSVNKYDKVNWNRAEAPDWNCIWNYTRNRNNHTTSDWNCIGIRVVPII